MLAALPGLRVVASWLAGANRMPWRRFLLWNALGGIGWASTVGATAYLLGRSASGSLSATPLSTSCAASAGGTGACPKTRGADSP